MSETSVYFCVSVSYLTHSIGHVGGDVQRMSSGQAGQEMMMTLYCLF